MTPKCFTGQYHESSLPGGEGLSYYNARWYDPKLGRFLSADTIVPRPANPQAFKRYKPDKLFMQFRCRCQPIERYNYVIQDIAP